MKCRFKFFEILIPMGKVEPHSEGNANFNVGIKKNLRKSFHKSLGRKLDETFLEAASSVLNSSFVIKWSPRERACFGESFVYIRCNLEKSLKTFILKTIQIEKMNFFYRQTDRHSLFLFMKKEKKIFENFSKNQKFKL